MCGKKSSRPTTNPIHNEMDEPLPNKPKQMFTIGMKATKEQIVHRDNSRM